MFKIQLLNLPPASSRFLFSIKDTTIKLFDKENTHTHIQLFFLSFTHVCCNTECCRHQKYTHQLSTLLSISITASIVQDTIMSLPNCNSSSLPSYNSFSLNKSKWIFKYTAWTITLDCLKLFVILKI